MATTSVRFAQKRPTQTEWVEKVSINGVVTNVTINDTDLVAIDNTVIAILDATGAYDKYTS